MAIHGFRLFPLVLLVFVVMFAALLLFCFIVLVLLLVRRGRRRRDATLQAGEVRTVQEMYHELGALAQRVDALETILMEHAGRREGRR